MRYIRGYLFRYTHKERYNLRAGGRAWVVAGGVCEYAFFPSLARGRVGMRVTPAGTKWR